MARRSPSKSCPDERPSTGSRPRRCCASGRKPSGEERWSFVSAAPVFTADGRVDLVVNVFRDFTERKRAEERLAVPGRGQRDPGIVARLRGHPGAGGEAGGPRRSPTGARSRSSAHDGTLQQLAVAHVDPAKLELAREWRRRYPPGPGSAVYQVLATGERPADPGDRRGPDRRLDPDPELRGFVRQLSLRSAMIAPLLVQEKGRWARSPS